MVHLGLANIVGEPLLAIDKPEGDMLANASANLLAQFDLAPDPKTQAIIGLLLACGAVYGPRVIMYRAREAQKAKEKQPGAAGIYDVHGNPAGMTTFNEGQN